MCNVNQKSIFDHCHNYLWYRKDLKWVLSGVYKYLSIRDPSRIWQWLNTEIDPLNANLNETSYYTGNIFFIRPKSVRFKYLSNLRPSWLYFGPKILYETHWMKFWKKFVSKLVIIIFMRPKSVRFKYLSNLRPSWLNLGSNYSMRPIEWDFERNLVLNW